MQQIFHYVQTFSRNGRRLVGSQPAICKTPEQAKQRAERAMDRAAGAVAFTVTGEPEFGEFEPPVVLLRQGEVPAEFG